MTRYGQYGSKIYKSCNGNRGTPMYYSNQTAYWSFWPKDVSKELSQDSCHNQGAKATSAHILLK